MRSTGGGEKMLLAAVSTPTPTVLYSSRGPRSSQSVLVICFEVIIVIVVLGVPLIEKIQQVVRKGLGLNKIQNKSNFNSHSDLTLDSSHVSQILEIMKSFNKKEISFGQAATLLKLKRFGFIFPEIKELLRSEGFARALKEKNNDELSPLGQKKGVLKAKNGAKPYIEMLT